MVFYTVGRLRAAVVFIESSQSLDPTHNGRFPQLGRQDVIKMTMTLVMTTAKRITTKMATTKMIIFSQEMKVIIPKRRWIEFTKVTLRCYCSPSNFLGKTLWVSLFVPLTPSLTFMLIDVCVLCVCRGLREVCLRADH